MSTVSYADLLHRTQPEIIVDARTHGRVLKTVDGLMRKKRLTAAEQKLLDLLAKLVNDYEETVYPTPDVPPAAMLKHLMEARGSSQADLARAVGIARSTISEVLKGKRAVSAASALRLGDYFHVEPSLFLTPRADG